MVGIGKMHLMEIKVPRQAFLLGPRPVLDQIKKLTALPAGQKVLFELPGRGIIPAQAIKLENNVVYEIGEAEAIKIIGQFGLKLGEDGIATEVIEGA